ncbi:MAG: DUF3794 domain-containing protein, partial [Oscillospiraceae bacterium]|nr:DUF3794 domain-containing protein [Oscillospiraceae bacterium]
MDLNLEKVGVQFARTVCRKITAAEVSAELIVPDSQPDVLQLLDTGAVALLRGKTLEEGKAKVSGAVSANVIYIPEGGGTAQCLNTEIPFEIGAESVELAEHTGMCVRLSLADAESRVINPRKLLVK